MSFHPNEVARRARTASFMLMGAFFLLLMAFFRTQVIQNARYAYQSEENRLREVPLPAPRGIVYDRAGQILAENLPGYSVLVLAPRADSLRATLRRLSGTIDLTADQIDAAVRRYVRNPTRPTVVLGDAPFDVVSMLEEHRIDYPGLIIQPSPKRFYPDGPAVASFMGYTGEITEAELASRSYRGYKAGQQIGKAGIEREYEAVLRGKEGSRFVEVDARGRVVREAGARRDLMPEPAPPLYTNIDLDLQKFIVGLFGDSLQGGALALEPRSGAVLALVSAPSYDPNRFIGGIPADYWRALNSDARLPLYNKVMQGRYPPGSTWKLATAVVALQSGLVTIDEHMPEPCTGVFNYGNRAFHCWDPHGHGDLSLAGAIEKSCDVYFYQLGLKVGLERLIAGGLKLGFRDKSGIDLPDEQRGEFPYEPVKEYYDNKYGPRNWNQSFVLSLAIGQGENAQTVANMARFYTALATDGASAQPEIAQGRASRTPILTLTADQEAGLRKALANVVSDRGTASASQIRGIVLAGKTGTAQNAQDPNRNHAWFVGFAPADDPKIVVAVMLEFGGHGPRAARIASTIVEHYLKTRPLQLINTDG